MKLSRFSYGTWLLAWVDLLKNESLIPFLLPLVEEISFLHLLVSNLAYKYILTVKSSWCLGVDRFS